MYVSVYVCVCMYQCMHGCVRACRMYVGVCVRGRVSVFVRVTLRAQHLGAGGGAARGLRARARRDGALHPAVRRRPSAPGP